jgi:hypothetical protein
MVRLLADPWRADHGAGAEVPFEDLVPEAEVDPSVESSDWSSPVQPPTAPETAVTFVDGVMRVELRVLAADGDARAWGLLGSYAAGAVRCDGAATFTSDDDPVGRALVVGGRVEVPAVALTVGASQLRYEPHSSPDDSPQGLRTRLQRLMLRAEQSLAVGLANGDLVFADGPLHFDGKSEGPVIGVIKRMVRSYLDDEHSALLPRLRPGERTPVFAFGSGRFDRYSWYQRLIPLEPRWHELAGIVRCEARMDVGLERAVELADATAHTLPRFAGRPGVDPRAPQNLTPVGALEAHLRHRLGSSSFLTRALQAHLAEVFAHD